jgi:hypothetical protein
VGISEKFSPGSGWLKKAEWKVKCKFCPWAISTFRRGEGFRPEDALNDLRIALLESRAMKLPRQIYGEGLLEA